MNIRSLNGQRTLTYGPQSSDAVSSAESPGEDWPGIPAEVPGNVELDMVAASRLEEPSVGNNIYARRELETYQ